MASTANMWKQFLQIQALVDKESAPDELSFLEKNYESLIETHQKST